MERIIITHLSGSKENQVEEFPLKHIKELSIGRDVASTIKYEPDADDLVSRQHARIAQDPQDETKFIITDLNSTNGTYLNKQRISGSAVIVPGDVVQLGPNGPEFEFDVEPRPKDVQGKTRVDPGMKFGGAHTTRETREEASRPIGRKTFEFVVGQIKGDTRKYLINSAAALLGIVALAAGVFIYQGMRNKQETEEKIADIKEKQPMSAATIAQKFGSATVFIESSWKLIDVRSGEQLYPLQMKLCKQEDKKGKCLQEAKYPVYILDNKTVKPLLVTQSQKTELKSIKKPKLPGRKRCIDIEPLDKPVGSRSTGLTGSGFVVSQDGFILTNRHVAAPWETQINWESQINLPPLPGILIVCEDKECNVSRYKILQEDQIYKSLKSWVPSKMQTCGDKPCKGKHFVGRHDYFYVIFPKTKLQIPARLVRTSDTADVALIKVDVHEPAEKVNLSEDDNVEPGTAITVMGYPDMLPMAGVRVRSLDPMNSESELRHIPAPTVTNGIIGRVMRGEIIPADGSTDEYFNDMGDVYLLTIDTPTAGNSGGPVFNNRGRVIGIFTYAMRDERGTQMTFAVPIKHGRDIMGTQRVLK
jgi:serine protease Do